MVTKNLIKGMNKKEYYKIYYLNHKKTNYSKGKNPNSRNGFKKGHPNYLKGHSLEVRDKIRKGHLGIKHSDEHIKNWKESRLKKNNFKHTKEWRLLVSKKLKGRKLSPEIIAKHNGKNHYNWQGGITSLQKQIRNSLKYSKWRLEIFTRDNFKCNNCGQLASGNLEAHHIKPLFLIIKENKIKTFEDALNCQEIWDINSGVTLCKECHQQTDSYLSKALKIEVINYGSISHPRS